MEKHIKVRIIWFCLWRVLCCLTLRLVKQPKANFFSRKYFFFLMNQFLCLSYQEDENENEYFSSKYFFGLIMYIRPVLLLHHIWLVTFQLYILVIYESVVYFVHTERLNFMKYQLPIPNVKMSLKPYVTN